MGKITQAQRTENYYKIYQQIYESPIRSISDISQNTGLSRNTITKYLQEMYTNGILVGPYIEMNPAKNYREYMHLLNFSDPFFAFNRLKGFPHVIDCSITFGDWNIIVVTDEYLDFSQLVGFQSVVASEVKGIAHPSKVEYSTWDECFQKMNKLIKEFTPFQRGTRERTEPYLDWGPDEWKLYHAFKSDLRQKVTPLLRKIKVRYDIYTR